MKLITICTASLLLLASCNSGGSKAEGTPKDSIKVDTTVIPDSIITTASVYEHNGKQHKGFMAYNGKDTAVKPLVMIIPEWWGVTDYVKNRAKQLAGLGYVAFVADMYGDGIVADNPTDAGALATPFYKDALMSLSTFNAAVAMAKTSPRVDTNKIAAIGYCFGGGNLINYARLGEKLKGIVSFHGSLASSVKANKDHVSTPILVLNGEADSMVPLKDREDFKKEMTLAKATYTFIDFPNAKHAFTNPDATATGEKYKIDIAYNKDADEKSWVEMKKFLAFVFYQP